MALNNFRFAFGTFNAQSLDASGLNAHESSRPRIFLLDHVIRDHRLDLFHIQETGRFGDVRRFFFPDLHHAVSSVGEIAHHSIATFYNPGTLVHVSSSILEEGRASTSIFRSKKYPEKVLVSVNVYGYAGNSRVDRQGQTNLLNSIGNSINDCKVNFPDSHFILAGDWNADFFKNASPKARELREFMVTHNLFETSLEVESTWRAKRGDNFSTSKLDHIFFD